MPKNTKTRKKAPPIRPHRHPSSYEANLSNMKLLISDSEFQSLVAEIREILKIPADGFSTTSELECFYERLCATSDEVLSSREYREQGVTIYDTYESGKIDQKEFCRQINQHDEKIPLNYKTGRIRFIIEKFNLPENYHDSINAYLVQGSVTAPYHNFTIGWSARRHSQELKIPRHVEVTFYTVPTVEDLREVKKQVDQMTRLKGLPRYHPMKNIDRDLDIESWYSQRVRFNKVSYKEYTTSTAEIAEAHLNNPKKADTVRAIVRDIKKTRKERFHSRGKK